MQKYRVGSIKTGVIIGAEKKNPRPSTSLRTGKRMKKNPSKGIRIVHNKLLGGWFVVRGPHQTPLNGRFNSKAEAQAWLQQKKNPRKQISPGDKLRNERYYDNRFIRAAEKRKIKRAKQRDYARRISMSSAKDNKCYRVSFSTATNKKGYEWHKLADFPFSKQGKKNAIEYARAFHRTYPRFQVGVSKQ